MNKRIRKVIKHLSSNSKVVEVNKHYYKLDNGEVIEHQFEIDDDITVEEFQKLLDNAKDIVGKLIQENTTE